MCHFLHSRVYDPWNEQNGSENERITIKLHPNSADPLMSICGANLNPQKSMWALYFNVLHHLLPATWASIISYRICVYWWCSKDASSLWKPPIIKPVMIVSLRRRVADNETLIRCSGSCRCRNTQKISKEKSDSTVCIEPVSVDSQQSIFNLVCIAQAWLVLGAQAVCAGPVCVDAVNSSVLLSSRPHVLWLWGACGLLQQAGNDSMPHYYTDTGWVRGGGIEF